MNLETLIIQLQDMVSEFGGDLKVFAAPCVAGQEEIVYYINGVGESGPFIVVELNQEPGP